MILFGPFELDPGAGELRRDGVPVKLQPQPLKVLALLVSRPGEIVTREQIRQAVWGDETYVDFDQGVGYCLSQIRGALGDEAQSPRYVQTLPRRGYRFLAPVRTVGRSPGSGRLALGATTRIAAVVLAVAAVLGIALRSSHPGRAEPEPEGAVRVPRTPVSDRPGVGSRPADPEAHRLTLIANHHAALRTPEGLEKALALYRQALEGDATHAPAWAGLAETLLALGDRGLRPAGDALAEADTAARRAIDLDPGLAAAHAVVGGVAHVRDWQWEKARESYEKALALNPADARVHRWYSHLLLTTGQLAAALEHARRAVELDPLSLVANSNLTCVLLTIGRYEEALEQARRTEQLEPATDASRLSRAEALVGLGRAEDALALLEGVKQPAYLEACSFVRAHTLKALGRTQEAREELRELLRWIDDPTRRDEASRGPTFFTRARILASLGEYDDALAELERSIESRDPEVRWLPTTEEFAPLRDDPRMKELYRRLGSRGPIVHRPPTPSLPT